jgi:Tol biopolymer transport system component
VNRTGKIAFASNRDVRLTNNPGVDIIRAWSPDGTMIAFIRATVSRTGRTNAAANSTWPHESDDLRGHHDSGGINNNLPAAKR